MTAVAESADVFVSYKKEDVDRVRLLVEALELQGWSVWWDPDIRTGDEWSDEIERAITGARCVVVVWSESSVKSSWVKREARFGDGRQILAPVMLDKVTPPVEFNHIQGADLVGWIGSPKDRRFLDLVRYIEGIVGKQAQDQTESAGRLARRLVRYRAHLVAAALALLSWATVGAYLASPVDEVHDLQLKDVFTTGVRFSIAARPTNQSSGGVSSSPATARFAVEELTAAARQGQALSIQLPLLAGEAVGGGAYASEMVSIGPPAPNGSLEVDAIELPVGSRLSIEQTPGGPGYTLRIDSVTDGMLLPVEVNARDRVSLWTSDGPQEPLDFGSVGREIVLESSTGVLVLEVTPDPANKTTPILENLPISGLELSEVEETVELGGSSAVRQSTVQSGTMVVAGREYDLGPSETIRFSDFQGLVGKAEIVDGRLRLDATGTRVGRIEAGTENEYRSLMPSRWRALRDPWPALVVVAAVLWATLLGLTIPRFWRAPR